jgi:hypothetical protein
MSLRFTLLRHLPAAAVRGYVLDRLARATAEGFGAAAPPLGGLPFAGRLVAYAEFTAAQAAAVRAVDAGPDGGLDGGAGGGGPGDGADGAGPTADEISNRLHREAESLGTEFRRRTGISEPREAFAALAFLYGQIGIEIIAAEAAAKGGGEPGGGRGPGGGIAPSGMLVTRCFFSDHYTPDTCRLMSALDAGVVAGLFGGTSLEFSERITEGAGCCRASLRPAEARR